MEPRGWLYKFPMMYDAVDWLDSFGSTNKARYEATRGLKGKKVLEVGVGTGKSLKFLKDCNVVGVDSSPRMINRACRLFPSVKLIIADATSLPFSDKSFDVVLFNFALSVITKPVLALTEGLRVAKQEVRILEFSRPDWMSSKSWNALTRFWGRRLYGSFELDINQLLEACKAQVRLNSAYLMKGLFVIWTLYVPSNQ